MNGEPGMKIDVNWEDAEEEIIDTTKIPTLLRPGGVAGTRDKRTHLSLPKPFIAWDGEGITYAESDQQAYVLLAASTGDYILAPEGQKLDTVDCLDLLFRIEKQHPGSIHIGFGFSYDMNQIMSSFTRNEIARLDNRIKKGRTYRWRNKYSFKVYPGKMLQISRGWKGVDEDYASITIYDTFGFFTQPFVEVVRSYAPEELHSIESGKKNRGAFKYEDMPEIIKYCLAENKLLVQILEKLRNYLHEAGIFPVAWHGPGAVANASLHKHRIKEYMGESPKEVRDASKFAYQSGRFETLRVGYHNAKVYEYDINSAYPSIICKLPQLSDGYWEHVKEWEPNTFSVWRCYYWDKRNYKYDPNFVYRAHPLFHRDERSTISFPPHTTGWYWEPEAALLTTIDYPADWRISEGWIWRDNTDGRVLPFKFVEERYYERQEMKLRGDGAERAIKLELNSIYGKTAQRAGWFQDGDKKPAYHQLEWAGYITSATRAKLYEAYRLRPSAIIAFETDAIFSVAPLESLKVGKGLGEWDLTIFDDLLYLQSGFYFAHQGKELINSAEKPQEVQRFRGFDKKSMTFEKVSEWLSNIPYDDILNANNYQLGGGVHRFVGFRRALKSKRRNYWRSWEDEERHVSIGRTGKRIHKVCPACFEQKGWMDGLHSLECRPPSGGKFGPSSPHKIPWEVVDYSDNVWAEDEIISSADGFL
jgi:hypothetical protein